MTKTNLTTKSFKKGWMSDGVTTIIIAIAAIWIAIAGVLYLTGLKNSNSFTSGLKNVETQTAASLKTQNYKWNHFAAIWTVDYQTNIANYIANQDLSTTVSWDNMAIVVKTAWEVPLKTLENGDIENLVWDNSVENVYVVSAKPVFGTDTAMKGIKYQGIMPDSNSATYYVYSTR